jgi:hypothetical protein
MLLVVGTVALGVLATISFQLIGGSRGLLFGTSDGDDGPPGAQFRLSNATPNPWGDDGFLGLSRYTAAELNRAQRQRQPRYVPSDVPSTEPNVVSVNPIDDFTWGVAALSDQTGRCYLILIVHNRRNPEFGTTKYDWLPRSEPCVGSGATRETVEEDTWPDVRS